MKPFKTLLKHARANARISVAILLAVLLVAALTALNGSVVREADARKTSEAQFENAPEEWLAHEKNLSEFRRGAGCRRDGRCRPGDRQAGAA